MTSEDRALAAELVLGLFDASEHAAASARLHLTGALILSPQR